jgi:hypothetical protein
VEAAHQVTRWLGEEEPVPICLGKTSVTAVEMIDGSQRIEDRKLRDAICMVHHAAEGRQRAAIMANDGEGPVPEVVHQSDAVAGFGSLRSLCMVWDVRRLGRLPR